MYIHSKRQTHATLCAQWTQDTPSKNHAKTIMDLGCNFDKLSLSNKSRAEKTTHMK